MKRVLIVIIFMGLIVPIYAQVLLEREEITQNTYGLFCKVDEKNISIYNHNDKRILSYGEFIDPTEPGEPALPSFDIYIAIPPYNKPQVEFTPIKSIIYNAVPRINPKVSIADSNFIYEQETQLKINKETEPVINKGYLWIGQNYCIHLNLNLFRVSRESLEVILYKNFLIRLKFDSDIPQMKSLKLPEVNPLILNRNIAKNTITKLSSKIPPTDTWIDYNSEYLKVGTDRDGIYRLLFEDLTSAGLNLSLIEPKTFKMFLRGKEIPVYVSGEDDGKFDENDFIEFAGQRNKGDKYREVSMSGEPYKEYFNRYSDTTIYWLTWNGTAGLRASIQFTITNQSADILNYYSELIHIEKNNWFDFSMADLIQREMPYWAENKTWHEGNLGVGTRNLSFKLSDVYPGETVKVFTKLQDYASNIYDNAHLLAISLNSNTKQDSGYINKYDQKVLEGIYNSNLLQDGANTLNVYSFPTEANPNLCIVDWYEIEYPRYLKAINDSLNFHFPFLTNNSIKAMVISNINSSKKYSLWKFGERYKKYVISPSDESIVLTDSVDGNDRFVLIDSLKTLRPKIYYKKKFQNLRAQSNNADYITITHKKFLKDANDYSQFITDSYSLETKVVDVDDIYDEFAYGFFQPEAIRDFLNNTHTNWQTPLPKYVFLIGGATYDYLGNKNKFMSAPKIVNYVPSFGAPVSDNWFVIWDTTDAFIPQMSIGRLPVTKNEELLWYYHKHRQYIAGENSAWNKKYLFFSGGTGNDQNQMDLLRNTNNFIIDNYVVPPPVGGNYIHFYKTLNPTTNFGPYSQQQFQNAIDSGGVFISYIGHSGTQTWDNSITDPGQLKNKIERYPLITDFGCSTAKFAEPDVISFSQLFVNDPDGQAIAYIGNSSLGFTTTSYNFPKLFYKKILKDSVHTIGDAHRLAKLDLINNYGASGVFKLFMLSNTLIGDPIVKLAIPSKTNLSMSKENVMFSSNPITDLNDSARVSIKYFNFGLVVNDTFAVAIDVYYNKTLVLSKIVRKQIPRFSDSITVSIPVKNQPGEHTLQIRLDSENVLDELSKNDNSVELNFLVTSGSIKMLNLYSVEGKLANPITFINPVSRPLSEKMNIEISSNKDFINSNNLSINFDTLYTKVNIPGTFVNKRVWLKSRLEGSNDYSGVISFLSGDKNNYSLSDSAGFSVIEKENLKLSGQKLSLAERNIVIKSLSAGFNDGNTALIQVNDQNLIPENTLGGHHIILLEDSTYNFVQYKRFYILGDAAAVQNYISFLDTLSNKFIAVFAVSDEGRVSSAELKNKIKQFGSKYIDSLNFRGSWAMIGKKGAAAGSVPEAYSNAFKGRVQVDTTITSRFNKGSFITSAIGPSAAWKNLFVTDSFSPGAFINYKLLGINDEGNIDTLYYLDIKDHYADLSSVDVQKYPFIKIIGEFSSQSNAASPSVSGLEVNYSGLPELSTNYQVVSISKDTLEQGENIDLSFYVYNAGESRADSFKVKVELVKPDNSKEKIFEQLIDSLGSENRKQFKVTLNTAAITGRRNLYISIDPENKIKELYKDNNIYSIPFYVKENTAPASLKLTFDGSDILDSDYISSNPNIRIELEDQSLIPIADTNAVEIFLNANRVPFKNNFVNYSFSANNPKYTIEYKPLLEDGEYTLKVIGKNATGQLIDPDGITRSFLVNNKTQLLSVYNYPNPFANDTYFTFKLTQIPDEIKIKIFTIAGRLVKEILLSPTDLNYDFNRIYWDGRDEDGGLLANGVYLYIVIMKKGSETVDAIHKLAIVR